MHTDAHAEGEAYHCSFHSDPTTGFQHAGPSTYFGIVPGPSMANLPLGALGGGPLGTEGPIVPPEAPAPEAVAVAPEADAMEPDAAAPEAVAPGRSLCRLCRRFFFFCALETLGGRGKGGFLRTVLHLSLIHI